MPVRLFSAAICALGAHALLYGTFRPTDGIHGYLGWYQPAIALAAIAAVVVCRPAWLRTELDVGDAARRLSTLGLVVLLLQESLERSFATGYPAFVSLTPAAWLVVLAGIGGTALLLALALRAGQVVASLLRQPPPSFTCLAMPRFALAVAPPPRRPLWGRVGLRAPPALA